MAEAGGLADVADPGTSMTGEPVAEAPRELVVVGVVGRAHGIRGEVSVELRTDEPERRFAVGQQLGVEVAPSAARRAVPTLTVAGSRWHQGRLLVAFAQVRDRTTAESARGWRLVASVDPSERPVEDDEFYDRQLIGLAAVTVEGQPVGTVRSIVHLPAQDLLELDTDSGVRLIPFVAALVPRVDLRAGLVVIDAPPGLLDGGDPSDG